MAPTELSCPSTELKLCSDLSHPNSIDFHNDIKHVFLKKMCNYDSVDNPNSLVESKNFESMKLEQNRYESFEGKWPLSYIKSVDLAEAGFFYLQRDDQVQCAFCKLILSNWEEKDIPLQEHKKNFPRCPFLTLKALENKHRKPEHSLSYCSEYVPLSRDSIHIKPKYPAMADIQRRLLTFKEWSQAHISPKALADCGFFYTGSSDFVTCFFCGESQGFWQPSDIPLNEHLKWSPNCGYLHLLKKRPPQKMVGTFKKTQDLPKSKQNLSESLKKELLNILLHSAIVKEAKEIFPFPVIQEVVLQRLTTTGEPFTSLHELARDVVNMEEKKIKLGSKCKDQNKDSNSTNICKESTPTDNSTHSRSSQSKGGAESNNIKLCGICMDEDRSVAFQPCGHVISCSQCADKISECPICRRTIENRTKIYFA